MLLAHATSSLNHRHVRLLRKCQLNRSIYARFLSLCNRSFSFSPAIQPKRDRRRHALFLSSEFEGCHFRKRCGLWALAESWWPDPASQ